MLKDAIVNSCPSTTNPRSFFLFFHFLSFLFLADAFKATVVDNPLQLVTQFVTSANYDKYQIHLRDRILVAHAVSYEGLLQDWQTLQDKVNYLEIVNSNHPNKVQAILDILGVIRKEQKGFGLDFGKQVLDTVARISTKGGE